VSEWAVVTGAARGLGREIARVLARRGLEVRLTDLDRDAVGAAAAEIGAASEGSVLDVRDAAACEALAEELGASGGGLAVWVNNAGVLATGPAWEQDAGERRRLLDVNSHGTFNGTLAALGPMRRAGRGHVSNVVSLAGLGAPPGETLYAASKHAAIAFSLGTLADLRAAGIDSVRISALCPDGIWTPMLHDKLDDPDAAPSFSGRLLQPATVAERVGHLLDHPRPVLTVPRSRGATVRLLDAFPGLASRGTRLWLADARRRQRRWARRLRAEGRAGTAGQPGHREPEPPGAEPRRPGPGPE
jgi:NAD(P)-dependent dehydrogenase (short-subunit alcohol dehydrogenase family)